MPGFYRSKTGKEDLEKMVRKWKMKLGEVEVDNVESRISLLSHYLFEVNRVDKIKVVRKAEMVAESIATNHVLCFAFNNAIDLEKDVSTKQLFDLYFNFAMANFDPDCKNFSRI